MGNLIATNKVANLVSNWFWRQTPIQQNNKALHCCPRSSVKPYICYVLCMTSPYLLGCWENKIPHLSLKPSKVPTERETNMKCTWHWGLRQKHCITLKMQLSYSLRWQITIPIYLSKFNNSCITKIDMELITLWTEFIFKNSKYTTLLTDVRYSINRLNPLRTYIKKRKYIFFNFKSNPHKRDAVSEQWLTWVTKTERR